MALAGTLKERLISIGGDISQSNFYRMKQVIILAMSSIQSSAKLLITRETSRL
jgi:hypothetical protein